MLKTINVEDVFGCHYFNSLILIIIFNISYLFINVILFVHCPFALF